MIRTDGPAFAVFAKGVFHEASVASLLNVVRYMEEELACEELKTQCTCKGKMGYVPSVPEF